MFKMLAALLLACLSTAALAAEPAITIATAQTPWYGGFHQVIEDYQKQTGNVVNVEASPFDGLLAKERAAVRSGQSPYDLLVFQVQSFIEFYSGGFLEPLSAIDPAFRLDPEIYTFDDTLFWNAASQRCERDGGQLMSIPVNPNVPVLFYRADLYAEHHLSVPDTFDQLLANAKALQAPPRMYGMVQRGNRGTLDIGWDFLPYLWGYGADIFRDQKQGDFTVVLNSPRALAALQFYIELAHTAGHPNTASVTQAEVIQTLVTGRGAQAMITVAAAPQMDNPDKSAVAGKIDYAQPPHAAGYKSSPPFGHWLGGIPHNLPAAQQKAALAFLAWFQTKQAQTDYALAGSPPVRRDVLESDLAQRHDLRWMPALAAALHNARQPFFTKDGPALAALFDLKLNQAVAGELTAAAALNQAAHAMEDTLQKDGYKTGILPDLAE
jgi:multiple sugar transport system substrate-binding protein